MQLRLRDARRTIRIDSEIDGFVDLARAVAAEARRRGADLDESTRANLGAARNRGPRCGRWMSDVLQINDLKVYLDVDAGTVKAVDGVSFRIPEGRTVALVGESGSGKTMVAQAIMSILPRVARIESGEILFLDPKKPGTVTDISRLDPEGAPVRKIRGGRISIIFQEPMTALSPLHTVGNQIGESLLLHRAGLGKAERRDAVLEMLRLVGFADPVKAEHTYPFELSGGLRQRAMIAMALVCRPALLVADEPTTALDVTIQAQILQLVQTLQTELKMAMLLITHDLGIVANMADEVVVMYHGKVVESGTVEDIFRDPRHPYLKALMRAVPRFNMAPGRAPDADPRGSGLHRPPDLGPRPAARRARGRRAAADGAQPDQALRDAQDLVPRPQARGRSARGRRRELPRRRRANASAWSANRAAARPPPPR